MSEDELIFLGAAILLAPMVAGKRIDPENDSAIRTATAYAHFLYEEVQSRKKRPAAEVRLTYLEHLKEHGKL